MSSYLVVAAVSEALRSVLWEQFEADDVIRPLVGSEAGIAFVNPTSMRENSSDRLSLWLYQVTENEFVKNQPVVRGNGHDTVQYPPMALNLYYLLTPFAPSGEADHMLLGKAMQVLYDNSIVLLRDTVSEISEELRISFCRLTLEELTRIWEALQEPYRLSVCYEVRVTRVDSLRTPSSARVVELNGRYGQMPVGAPR